MGINTWSYTPEKCDGDYCPCNCNKCPKAYDGEHVPFSAVFEAVTGENFEAWKEKIADDRND